MRPKTDAVIYRPDLGQHVMEFMEGATMNFIGLQIMPFYPVAVASSSFPVLPMEAFLSLNDTSRAPRSAYKRDDWEYERGFYITKDRGWEQPIDDTERTLLEQEMRTGVADRIAVERATKIILRAQEYRIANKVFDASTFSATDVTNEWDDATNATPIDDIKTAKQAFRLQCGALPDALVINYNVFENLKSCDQIKDIVKYTFPMINWENIGPSQIAQALGVPRILVGGSIYNSNGVGLDASISDIWDDEYAALVKISNSMDLTEPCFGRTFMWTADAPSNAVVESYREEQIRSDVFRVRHHVDERLIQSTDDTGTVVSNIADKCIYLLGNITS